MSIRRTPSRRVAARVARSRRVAARLALSRRVAAVPALGAVALVAAALGASVLVTPATPAHAASACCNPTVSGLPGSVTTGTPVQLTVSIRNRGRTSYAELRRVFVIRLGRLDPAQVTVERSDDGQWTPLSVDGNAGTVRATDPGSASLRSGATEVARYRLTFAAGAPTGKASLIAEAYGQRGGDWTLIGHSGAAGTTVRQGAASPSTSPTESEAASMPVATGPEQSTTPANTGIRTDSGGMSLAPFAIAGVLLILLGGLGGWWLIKRNNAEAQTGEPFAAGPAARYAPPNERTQVVRYGSPGVAPGPAVYTSGQRQSSSADSTMVFPGVQDQPIDATQRIELPPDPPPVDPFDHTRQFERPT